MALFGAPDPPSPAPTPMPVAPAAFPSAVSAPVVEEEPPLSAFEKRAALRAQRHELVATLSKIDGRSFREINASLNRDTGVRKVEDATIAQLEKSIERLYKELDRTKSKRSRGRATAAR